MNEPPETLKTRKAQLRQSAMLLRDGVIDRHKDAATSLIEFAEGFDPESPAAVVSGYVPMGSEIDDMALLKRFHQRGFTLGLPVVTAKATPLTFLKYCPGDRLVKGSFDVFTPEPNAKIVTPAILLVPLLAFDRTGYRLGYGGGFYDRTLALLRQQGQIKAIGLAFSAQEVEAVPHDGLDQPLDAVLCENGLIEF